MGGYAQDLYPGHTYSRGATRVRSRVPSRVRVSLFFEYYSKRVVRAEPGLRSHTPFPLRDFRRKLRLLAILLSIKKMLV